MAVSTVSVREAKARFSELSNRVVWGGERFIIQRHGKPFVALVGVDDLKRIEGLEGKLEQARKVPGYVPAPQEVADMIDWFRERIRAQETEPPSPDDEFIGGLSYREYFALTDAEAEALWNELAADAPPTNRRQALHELRAAYLTMSGQERQAEIAYAEEGLRGQLSPDEAFPGEEE